MKYCVNCGKQIADNASFCEHCGKPTGIQTNPVNMSGDMKPKKNNRPIIIGAIAIIAIILIGAGAIALVLRSGSKETGTTTAGKNVISDNNTNSESGGVSDDSTEDKEPGLYENGEMIHSWDEMVENGWIVVDDKNNELVGMMINYDDEPMEEEDPYEGIYKKASGNSLISGELYIKSGISSIRRSALLQCKGLTYISIPNSVTSIGTQAFQGCTGLTNVDISDSVTNIGNSAFCECVNLTNINIPKGVTKISFSTFSYCTGLTSINIPDNVTSIGGAAFAGCTNLTSITIPDSVTKIDRSAFSNCSSSLEINYNGSAEGYPWMGM